MSSELKNFELKALKLPLKERAALAESLINSLDSSGRAENEKVWLEESEKRYEEYKKGNIASRQAVDVMRDARNNIQ